MLYPHNQLCRKYTIFKHFFLLQHQLANLDQEKVYINVIYNKKETKEEKRKKKSHKCVQRPPPNIKEKTNKAHRERERDEANERGSEFNCSLRFIRMSYEANESLPFLVLKFCN